MKNVLIHPNINISNENSFVLISGPCQIESKDHAEMMASKIKNITDKLDIPLVFKSSYDKANRTSASSKRGVGIKEGLRILEGIGIKYGLSTITDIHEAYQADIAAQSVDILQIPAFLCRQTDLLEAAAKTGKPVMVKKGQFLSPRDMHQVAKKLEDFGCTKILLCERGASFGYNTLVSDMRGLPIMAETGWPVIFDATHSVQQPGGMGGSSGGERRFVETLAKAATAVGVAGLFIETHDNPDAAPSDGANMIAIDNLEKLLYKIKQLDNLVKSWGE